MIDKYESIGDAIVRRMGRRITVRPTGSAPPYCAYFPVGYAPSQHLPGHPYALVFEAATPREAIGGVIDMIGIWLEDPRDPVLEMCVTAGRRRAPGLTPGLTPQR